MENLHKIPLALKQNVWLKTNGQKFKGRCYVKWCNNRLTPFTFEAGHNIPFSKGGKTTIDNLFPICSTCNKSMGNRFTIEEFSEQFKEQHSFGCFGFFKCCNK
jgi:5-methylcytosine-specific restriction endonuclease McrA